MNTIKVLIVDDSAVIRKVLGDCLREDPQIEIVGTAANGKIALQEIERLKPDVITLDIEMPEMNGLETVQHIRQRDTKLPIIMCSSLTAAGATHTLDALSFGASDYVTKPSSHGANTRDVVGEDLIRKIKELTSAASGGAVAKPLPALAAQSARPSLSGTLGLSANVVAIGVSTGGPNALAELLPLLPADLPIPVLIVQHMPPVFTKLLAERLHSQSPLTIVEAEHDQEVVPGRVYLAPGGQHMEVRRILGRVVTTLNEGPPENSCRPAVDVLFRSVAKVYGGQALAVMLTGMGQDGLKGCEQIKSCGGSILAQDRQSCAVWGMPGAVVDAGLVRAVLSLDQIAAEIMSAASNSTQSTQAYSVGSSATKSI
jgi:two-component system chemotaxis response regulator CheB